MIRIQATPIHQCMAENGKVRWLRGRRMNKESSLYCKAIFQIVDAIQTEAATEDLQEEKSQLCWWRIIWYVLVFVTLILQYGFPISISTMKEVVFIGVTEYFPCTVSFFIFYGLHVMVEGVRLEIEPCFHSPPSPNF